MLTREICPVFTLSSLRPETYSSSLVHLPTCAATRTPKHLQIKASQCFVCRANEQTWLKYFFKTVKRCIKCEKQCTKFFSKVGGTVYVRTFLKLIPKVQHGPLPLFIVYILDWFRIGLAFVLVRTYPSFQISVQVNRSWIKNACRVLKQR